MSVGCGHDELNLSLEPSLVGAASSHIFQDGGEHRDGFLRRRVAQSLSGRLAKQIADVQLQSPFPIRLWSRSWQSTVSAEASDEESH